MATDPAREIVKAVDRLTTQVRRLSDHLTTPVTTEPTTRDDGRLTCPTCRTTGVWAGVPLHWWNCPDRPTKPRDPDPEQRTPNDCSTTAFRDALLVLLSRAARGVLTPDEGPLLRQHVEQLLRDRDQLAARTATLEHVARSNRNHHHTAARALERVQALADRLDADARSITPDAVHPVAAHIRAALNAPTAEG